MAEQAPGNTCQFSEGQTALTILHFNDVYEIQARSEEPVGGAARFASALRKYRHLNPFVAFSGDCLSPSVLSTVTKGKHMVDILNTLGVHCAVYGNHEFDFGMDVLEDFVQQMKFPWFLSNVYNRCTSQTLGNGVESSIIEWNGLKIGLLGLVEEDWLDTLSTVDKANIEYRDYVCTANRLSQHLRECGADLIIALTHMRWHNDIRLAKESKDVDLILGGHDHEYGVQEVNGILIVKSGSEFRYLSKVDVMKTSGKTFKYTVQEIPISKIFDEDPCIKKIVEEYYKNIQHMLRKVLCHTNVDLDARFVTVRHAECSLGNLITNAMLEATHAEVAILNSGTLRSDRIHPAGPFTMHDLLQILPIKDPVLVVEATGQQLYDGLENGVWNYPTFDGRFPQVAGIQFGFDPEAPSGRRVFPESVKIQGQNLDRNGKYLVAIKEYLSKGKDGYSMFTSCPQLFHTENAQILSTILINHFESGENIKGQKNCKSGHSMDLLKVPGNSSVSDIEITKSDMMEMSVTVVPAIEGRIMCIPRKTANQK
ncbi:trifunctional nucleotide phosphoesterase protein YfkN-like [Myxocyprinus asiaticus]|uniref:trifunctional nucleotide phosphoesterase protein YfkN-like n=1 Tax=Myxocyprinus asiaticus TaxID=70543 RepID=UPI0022232DCA|nr:trifunctional nucleotide phosphoesterase protein YfkN-like [Myxocyprinus asiaticus]